VNFRLRLAHTGEISYTETHITQTEVDRLHDAADDTSTMRRPFAMRTLRMSLSSSSHS